MHLQPSYGQTETSPCVSVADWDEPDEEKAVSAGKAVRRLGDYRLLQRRAVYYHVEEASDNRAKHEYENTGHDVNSCCHYHDSFLKTDFIVP